MISRTRFILCAALLLGACSKGAEQHDTDSAKSAGAKVAKDSAAQGAMKDMPGMSEGSATEDAKSSSASTTVSLSAAQVQHGKVAWEPVSMSTAATSVAVPGQLVPNEDRTSRLGAPASGRVLSVHVQPGDPVSRGQRLVTIQSPAAGMAQSDLAKARAEVTSRGAQAQYARSARERAERLLTLKAIPRQDYDRAIADDEAAAAALAQARAELERAGSTAEQLGANASASGEIALRSPLAGVVLARTAVPGAVIDAGAPLVVVTDPATLWLQVNAAEKFASLFRAGGRLRFTVPAYPADTFSARIDAIGAGLSPETRTLPVRGVVPSAGKLKAEMLATVLVEGGASVVAAVVPDDAIQLLDGKPVVFVAKPDGKGGATFEARSVDVASRSGGRAAVTHGLSAGDVVVTRGAFAVKAQLRKSSMGEMVM